MHTSVASVSLLALIAIKAELLNQVTLHR